MERNKRFQRYWRRFGIQWIVVIATGNAESVDFRNLWLQTPSFPDPHLQGTSNKRIRTHLPKHWEWDIQYIFIEWIVQYGTSKLFGRRSFFYRENPRERTSNFTRYTANSVTKSFTVLSSSSSFPNTWFAMDPLTRLPRDWRTAGQHFDLRAKSCWTT